MLSHQRWPYVGRFARGWHRLPGMIPGQPQTRTRARLRIGSSCRAAQRRAASRDRPGRGDRMDLRGAGLAQDVRGRGHRRARGQHVIDEQDARWAGAAGAEDAVHRHPPFGAGAARLRCGRDRTAELPSCGTLQAPSDRHRQRSRLIEPALRSSGARERDPGHDVDVGDRACAGDGVGERGRDVAPSRELEAKNGAARRPVVDERRSRRRQGRRRAVGTRCLRLVGRRATPLAPRRLDRPKTRQTVGAERPRSRAAAGARTWEQGVEHRAGHRTTVPAGTDMLVYSVNGGGDDDGVYVRPFGP